jgi:hypothetical protein
MAVCNSLEEQAMKKHGIWIGMVLAAVAILLADRTESILMNPQLTPAQFLDTMPYWTVVFFGRSFILIQPSSTFFVYLLGFLMIGLGVLFLKKKTQERSRFYFGVGLILWGVGTLLAGSSYQAFGYELKCAGLDYCTFTSKFELTYLLITGFSIDFLMAGIAHASLPKSRRGIWIRVAAFHSLAYFLLLFIGVLVPVQLLVTYEFFMAFYLGSFLLMFVWNIRHARVHQDLVNKRLIVIWILFLLVNVGYFIALFSGYAEPLYEDYGIWFNANDVLHVLIILWAAAIYKLVYPILKDSNS